MAPCYALLAANASVSHIAHVLNRSRKRIQDFIEAIGIELNIPKDSVKEDALKHGRFRGH